MQERERLAKAGQDDHDESAQAPAVAGKFAMHTLCLCVYVLHVSALPSFALMQHTDTQQMHRLPVSSLQMVNRTWLAGCGMLGLH